MMPPYDRDLDDAQIDAVVDFLRRFDPRQAAASPKAKP
jgi:mono/diheme cytochrome c family protein